MNGTVYESQYGNQEVKSEHGILYRSPTSYDLPVAYYSHCRAAIKRCGMGSEQNREKFLRDHY